MDDDDQVYASVKNLFSYRSIAAINYELFLLAWVLDEFLSRAYSCGSWKEDINKIVLPTTKE